jgi:uncharacterized protein YkwD
MTGSGRAARLTASAVVAAFAVLFAVPAQAAPPLHRRQAAVLGSLERGVLADINAFRRQHHLTPLRISPELNAAARLHSREMAADGYFAHASPGGGAFWKRIERFYPPGTWAVWSVGENLLWVSPEVSPAGALQLWEKSPEHRANLLTARWREIGISAVHATAAPGVFHGLDVTIVTTDFGVRG